MTNARLTVIDCTAMPLDNLDREKKMQLLSRLRKKLKSLVLSLEAPFAPIGAELPSDHEAGLADKMWRTESSASFLLINFGLLHTPEGARKNDSQP